MHWVTDMTRALKGINKNDTVTLQGKGWTREVRPHRYLREMFPHVIEEVLDQEYRALGFEDLILGAEDARTSPYSHEGGILFKLPTAAFGTPEAMGMAIKSIHTAFVETHEKIWSLFVANYEQVRASEWTEEYELHPWFTTMQYLSATINNRDLRLRLLRISDLLQPIHETPDPMHWLYKGPSYSMALYKHGSDYILSLLPHLMHPTNWLAALGIFEVRQSQDIPLDKQRLAARNYVGRLAAAIPPPDNPPMAA